MVMTIGIASVAETSVVLDFANWGPSGSIELQVSPRRDFKFCVCPIYTGLIPGSPRSWGALNQRSTYYFRARARLADGSAELWSNVVAARTLNGPPQNYASGAVTIEPTIVVTPEQIMRFAAGMSSMPGFPAANLAIDAPVAFQQLSTYAAPYYYNYIAWDMGANASIDTIALLNTNLPEDAVMSLRCTNNPDYVTDRVDLLTLSPFRASPNLPGRMGYHCFKRFAPPPARYWAIDIRSSAVFLHAEHLIVGTARVSKNHSRDKSETANPQTTSERNRLGLVDRQSGLPMRKVEFDLSALTETQYETLYGDLIYRANEPILVVPNSKNGAFLHDRILYGDLSGGRVVNVSSPYFTRSFSVDSII
jgi:hypothetical protein